MMHIVLITTFPSAKGSLPKDLHTKKKDFCFNQNKNNLTTNRETHPYDKQTQRKRSIITKVTIRLRLGAVGMKSYKQTEI